MQKEISRKVHNQLLKWLPLREEWDWEMEHGGEELSLFSQYISEWSSLITLKMSLVLCF